MCWSHEFGISDGNLHLGPSLCGDPANDQITSLIASLRAHVPPVHTQQPREIVSIEEHRRNAMFAPALVGLMRNLSFRISEKNVKTRSKFVREMSKKCPSNFEKHLPIARSE
jgi:hypothetical protein